jgi:hypothetical protein
MVRLIVVGSLMAVLFGAVAPLPARARQATPAPAPPGSLAAMLQLAPDVLSGVDEAPVQIATYADLAAQTAVAGMSVPTSVDDPNFVPWAFALLPLIMPDALVNYALAVDWHALLGVDLLDIDQSLQVGEPPLVFTLLRGRFDETAIEAAWTSQGYTMLDVDGVVVASLHEDASFDLETDLGRYAFARFNNAAILPDGTLAYSPTLDGMRLLIATAQGTIPSLGDRVDVAALVGAIEEPLASAMLVTGAALQGATLLGLDTASGTAVADELATRIAEFSRMPPILMALLGVTPGGPLAQPLSATATPNPDVPPAQFEIALLLPTQAAAETAAEVATERLATGVSYRTGRPLTDYFATWDARVLADPPIVVLELGFAPDVQPRIWLQMIAGRDLPFLAW